jgi:hypothetical protein
MWTVTLPIKVFIRKSELYHSYKVEMSLNRYGPCFLFWQTSYNDNRYFWWSNLYLFFLKVGWIRPKRGCLLTLAYYAFPRWYEFGGRRWNDIDRGKEKNSEKNLPLCPSQIPHALIGARTRASTVTGRRTYIYRPIEIVPPS